MKQSSMLWTLIIVFLSFFFKFLVFLIELKHVRLCIVINRQLKSKQKKEINETVWMKKGHLPVDTTKMAIQIKGSRFAKMKRIKRDVHKWRIRETLRRIQMAYGRKPMKP